MTQELIDLAKKDRGLLRWSGFFALLSLSLVVSITTWLMALVFFIAGSSFANTLASLASTLTIVGIISLGLTIHFLTTHWANEEILDNALHRIFDGHRPQVGEVFIYDDGQSKHRVRLIDISEGPVKEFTFYIADEENLTITLRTTEVVLYIRR